MSSVRCDHEVCRLVPVMKRERPHEPASEASYSSSVRPDGSTRPAVRVREGYIPPDALYQAPRPQRFLGECIQWSAKLQWGFIRPDDLTANVFVHMSSLTDGNIRVGDPVEFERRPAREGERADSAINVRVYRRHVDSGSKACTVESASARSSISVSAARSISGFVPRAVAARAARDPSGASQQRVSESSRKKQHPEYGVLGLL
jgi:cold shock CspA family protein